jgi:hypothetical protein
MDQPPKSSRGFAEREREAGDAPVHSALTEPILLPKRRE